MKLHINNRDPEETAAPGPAADPAAATLRTHPASAFTLMEMILAVGIAAIALLCASVVLFTALRFRSAVTRVVDAAIPVDAAVAQIKRDIECCVSPTNGTTKVLSGGFRAGPGIVSAGVDEPVEVEMFTATGALSTSAPWADIQRVTYGLKNPMDIRAPGRDLYRTVLRNLLAVSTPEVEEQFMLAGVEKLTVTCYDGLRWQETWDTTGTTSSGTNLPLAVRVEIQMVGSGADSALQMIVPIDSVVRTNRILTAGGGNSG